MKNVNNKKLVSLFNLSRILSDKHPTSTIVLTDGVFDTYHSAQAQYIHAAAQEGDILIVGIHSDSLVKKRKGNSRPLFSFEERLVILSDNQNIDFILELKDQENLYNNIRKILPDVLVISESTTDTDNCPQTIISMFKGYARKILVLKPFSERHSTDLIESVKEELTKN